MILSRCWHPLVQYIEERFQQFLQAETRINRLGSSHCDNDNDNYNYNDQARQLRTTESTPSSTSSRQQDMDSGNTSRAGVGGYVASLDERKTCFQVFDLFTF